MLIRLFRWFFRRLLPMPLPVPAERVALLVGAVDLLRGQGVRVIVVRVRGRGK